MVITPFAITELAGAVGVVGAAVAGLLMAVFKSRCTELNCCWGGCVCTRVPPADAPPVPAGAVERELAAPDS